MAKGNAGWFGLDKSAGTGVKAPTETLKTHSPSFNALFGKYYGLPRGYTTVLWGAMKSGKCSKWNSIVTNPFTGEQITIEDAYKSKMTHILSYNEATHKMEVAKITDWYDSGVRPMIKVTLKNGLSTETSHHHPYLTLDRGWVEVKDLQKGDKVAIPLILNQFGTERLSKDEAFVMGSLIADGGMSQEQARWTKTDPLIRQKMFECARAFGVKPSLDQGIGVNFVKKNKENGNTNKLTKWIKTHEMGVLSKDKKIPKIIFRSDKETCREFITAIFSGDGSYAKDKNIVEYGSASEQLTKELQSLLLRFGITSIFSKRTTFYNLKNGDKKEFPSSRLNITGFTNVKRFFDTFPVIGSKWDPAHDFYKNNNDSNPADFDTASQISFPIEMWDLIDEACLRNNTNLSKVYRELYPEVVANYKYDGHHTMPRHDFNKKSNVSLPRLRQLNSVIKDPELQKYVDGEVGFIAIKSIEKTQDAQCYDLTVEGTHNFVCNDMLIHNTVLAWDFVSHLHETDPEARVVWFDTEMRAAIQMGGATSRGIDHDRVLIKETNVPKEIFDFIENDIPAAIEAGAKIPLIVIDSLSAIRGRQSLNSESIDQLSIGDQAKTLQDGFMRILPVIRRNKIAVVCISQARAEMDQQQIMMRKTQKMSLAYGTKHFIEFFIKISQVEAQKGKVYDVTNDSILTGNKIRAVMEESSCGGKGRLSEFTLDYSKGIVNVGLEAMDWAKNYGVLYKAEGKNGLVFEDKHWKSEAAAAEALNNDSDLLKRVIAEVSAKLAIEVI